MWTFRFVTRGALTVETSQCVPVGISGPSFNEGKRLSFWFGGNIYIYNTYENNWKILQNLCRGAIIMMFFNLLILRVLEENSSTIFCWSTILGFLWSEGWSYWFWDVSPIMSTHPNESRPRYFYASIFPHRRNPGISNLSRRKKRDKPTQTSGTVTVNCPFWRRSKWYLSSSKKGPLPHTIFYKRIDSREKWESEWEECDSNQNLKKNIWKCVAQLTPTADVSKSPSTGLHRWPNSSHLTSKTRGSTRRWIKVSGMGFLHKPFKLCLRCGGLKSLKTLRSGIL